MARATIPGGMLTNIQNCTISIPGSGVIELNNLPEISDSKEALYSDEQIMGRSTPLKTFSSSSARSIGMQLHFYVINQSDIAKNLSYLRAIQSAVYPRTETSGLPFLPPPVCQIQCNKLLGDNPLCVILRSYNVKFPTDVAWDDGTYLPYKLDIDTTWEVVYSSTNLPGSERILSFGS